MSQGAEGTRGGEEEKQRDREKYSDLEQKIAKLTALVESQAAAAQQAQQREQ